MLRYERPTLQFYRDRPDVFREVTVGNFHTFKYISGGIDFSDRRARLARGITFDDNGDIVLVGFEKFFTRDQMETRETISEDFKEEYTRLQTKNTYTAYEKLDGSMIILGVYKGEFITSTSGRIDSVESKTALRYIESLENKEEIKEYLEKRNSCFIFEYISVFNRILVTYDTPIDLVLLAEISKDTLSDIEIENDFGFARPHIYKMTEEDLEKMITTSENFEGVIVFNDYGKRIKIKTDWWFNKTSVADIFSSRGMLTKKNIRTIINYIEIDEIDDLLAFQNKSTVTRNENKIGVVYDLYLEIADEIRDIASKYDTPMEVAEKEESPYKYYGINYMNSGRLPDRVVMAKLIIKILKEKGGLIDIE